MTDKQDDMIDEAVVGDDEQISDEEFVDELDDEVPGEEDFEEPGEAGLREESTDNIEQEEESADSFEEGVGFDVTMESVVEAVLFASDEPLSAERLVNIVEAGSVKKIRECIEKLNEKYNEGEFSFRIEQIAGGYQMMTLSEFNYWLKKLVRVRTDTKLSPAALETLAIVAYKQPVIRADIEAIRGVASGEVIRNLMFKGLVKMVGKAEVLGRPMLYGTTKKFLDIFGLHTLKDLPTVEELKRPEE
jgi:segregation and condensation protein B